MKLLVSLILFSIPLLSDGAAFQVSESRGSSRRTFLTPEGKTEICIIPQHTHLGKYSKKDLKDEKELCSYDFNGSVNDSATRQMALCPKLNSSNPGVLLMEIPRGWDRSKFESQMCLKENPLQKTQAKFKQTITCSYTPSILAYYHFSRFLEGAGRVPVAVLRTMSTDRHFKIAQLGTVGTKSVGGIIHTGWKDFEKRHLRKSDYPLVFDSTGQFVFGALQDNVKHENIYYEIVGTGKYEDRYNTFVKKEFYQVLKNPGKILSLLGSNQFHQVAQKILTLKDATDMILLDTLLTQQDRMYNQHFKWAWVWVEDNQVKSKFVDSKLDSSGKLVSKKAEEISEFTAEKKLYLGKQAALVKQLIMKDNDCGLRAGLYRNRMKDVKALEGIRHLSGKTYSAFMRLAQSFQDSTIAPYLKNETLMNDADFKLLSSNISEIKQDLLNRCRSGNLKLDLDLETYFTSQPQNYPCDI
jgi:hypothetical protein